MKTIWKYEIPIKDYFEISMPNKSRVISVGMQEEVPVMWVIVDTESEKENKIFRFSGTGHLLNEDENLIFLGTIQYHLGLVFHLFQIDPY